MVAAIVSISAARTVKTRWGTKELVEVIVGDDTRASAFTVTFWAPASTAGLARQDVVLLRNVALGVFRGLVGGMFL
ncbi:nucleic acid-binding, OB-fold protein [Ophiocordyceps camponoti-floridani]|uniref:Nucleic acid-binding, OB-fold protein n=1 Tax=Ophiocordyceps camponoti-floridani TaxID=2030778 RepID=A0A8H4QDQ0_9HYPO|nr:nucleic acid-binding, OB-fold protein [Ophiocordyceps camponoti-floridani]